jgi:pimeloyl-ACP methyl ester carboxylesterase
MSLPKSVPPLTPAVAGQRIELQTSAGLVSFYQSNAVQGAVLPPLLLVHSVNAAASVAEVAPLYNHYSPTRPTFALDLPGFGFSNRSDRPYTIRLMTDAVLAVLAHIRSQHGGVAVDVLGVSLASEYVARIAVEAPEAVRRIALVSPTGFSGSKRFYGAPGSSRGVAWAYRLVSNPAWSSWLFNNLTRPAVVRYFLQRTFGRKQVDDKLWRYCVLTAKQPGAKHAPLCFLSAYLFAADINTLYEKLACPVWVSMATRGDFTDYWGRSTVDQRTNWQFELTEGGALPYFEDLASFTAKLDTFLGYKMAVAQLIRA